ncbi:hypothetical protein PTSG_11570 [Salpingoeca rosetta]|uniref:Uncharacterized protein n=1 Tax=Salpingoeca rosetta (strain ATCC 50818 / BSB-021) TaxID=946362 RepID=F2TW04_SALR5|nr:uncharacterized protein PTSG_11570 [Salpingoeca rosetta]EGD72250.1 hypothetical protein PTSG_11570 [Salpingoeca rosetta]|eukprot:XP_004998821.1 hypothetical protein PTSG_11570 [Salpingoeca rosetta]
MARLQGVVVAAVAAMIVIVLLVMQARLNAMSDTVKQLQTTLQYSQQTGGAALVAGSDASAHGARGARGDVDDALGQSVDQLTHMVQQLQGAFKALSAALDDQAVQQEQLKHNIEQHQQHQGGPQHAQGQQQQDQPAKAAPAESEDDDDAFSHSISERDPRRLCIAVPSAARPGAPMDLILSRLKSLREEIDGHKDRVVLRQAYSARNNVQQRQYARQLGFVVEVDTVGWKDLNAPDIKLTLGDPIDRVRWRSRQVADFAMTLKRCAEFNVTHVLLLEDDASPAKNFTTKMFNRISALPTQDFGYVSLYSGLNPPPPAPWRELTAKDDEGWFHGGDGRHGAVALLMHRKHVPGLADFLLENKLERPVDWLIPGYFGAMLRLRNFELIPNLAQHISSHSTLSKNKNREKWKSHSFVYDEAEQQQQ